MMEEVRAATRRALAEQLAGGRNSWRNPVKELSGAFKPAFGSLFAYADDDDAFPVTRDRVAIAPSLARGGLSNVWGAGVMPYAEGDLDAWPLRLDDLAHSYREVLRHVPLVAEDDGLEPTFPMFTPSPGSISPTPQIRAFLDDLRRRREYLGEAGVSAGRARVAVWAEGARGCRRIGLCLHGCPYGSIYNSGATLEELVRQGHIRYRPGTIANRIEERSDGARIWLTDAGTGVEAVERRERVFVACGVLATTRLMLCSLDHLDEPLRLADSQYFAFPLLRIPHARVSLAEPANTLAQAFIDIADPALGPNLVHFSVYGYNDLMLEELAARMRLAPSRAEVLLQPLLGRLLFAQGYLHSDLSPALEARLVQEGGGIHRLVVSPVPNRVSGRLARTALRKLRKLIPATRAVPVTPMLEMGLPGKSFHVGGAFPMRERAGALETDMLGRLGGWRRVHLVDASVFPSVPATPITLTAMANAARVAARHVDD